MPSLATLLAASQIAGATIASGDAAKHVGERSRTAAELSEVGWSDLGALIFLVFRRAGIDANKQQRTKGYSKTKGHICKQTEWEPW